MRFLYFQSLICFTFQDVLAGGCRTNNDCESGRCEWRRCVAQLGKLISGKQESAACYVDHDCPKQQVCKDGLCQARQPLMTKLPMGNRECIADEDCPPNHKCGLFKKCYDMQDPENVVESIQHIPCIDEPADFCPKATGFPNARCTFMENYGGVPQHVCVMIDMFSTPTCSKDSCPRYNTCAGGSCYPPSWITVRKRCTNDSQCAYRSKCNQETGVCSFLWSIKYQACRINSDCTPATKKRCVRFECWYRRSKLEECAACQLDEFCDNYHKCHRVQRYAEVDCINHNWFYWAAAFYCSMRTQATFDEAEAQCKALGAELIYPPDRGTETVYDPEKILLAYLAVRDGWVKEGTDEKEQTFVDWTKNDQRNVKSKYFCKKKITRSHMPNNATAYSGQKCQTSFIYRNGRCYIGGFTNFMPRFAVRSFCGLLDSEIVEIKNEEELRTVYGLAGGKSFWLGLRKEKRDWYWDGGFYGHRAHYFLWRTGQPDLTNSKNCVYSPYAGEWMSADCDNFHSPRVFICQRPPYK